MQTEPALDTPVDTDRLRFVIDNSRLDAKLDRIEGKLDALLALLERYQPLLDAAEQRLTGKPRHFGGNRAQSQS